MPARPRLVVLAAFITLALGLVHTQAGLPETERATPDLPVSEMNAEEREAFFRGELARAYLGTYGPGLQRYERLPRLVATLAIARLDTPEATRLLLDALGVASGAEDPPRRSLARPDAVVSWLAWEALHTRVDRLDDEQRDRWLVAGVVAAANGAFPGKLVRAPIEAAASRPADTFPDDALEALAVRVVTTTPWNADAPAAPLGALRQALAAWRDRSLVVALVDRDVLQLPGAPAKVGYVLGDHPGAPAEAGSDAGALRAHWRRWLTDSPDPAPAEAFSTYAGRGELLPPPEAIDLDDQSWRDAFEAGAFEVRGVDLAWVIDATGSMAGPNKKVAFRTGRVLGLLSVLSDRVRGAAVYVRHETLDDLQNGCCRRAERTRSAYAAKPYPLTRNILGLARVMYDEPIPKPDQDKYVNMHPGTAVHGGLMTAYRKLNWNTERPTLHAVVVVADSHLEKKTRRPAALLANEMARRGIRVHALHVSPDDAYRRVFEEAAGGKVLRFHPHLTDDDRARFNRPSKPLASWLPADAAARVDKGGDAFERVSLEILLSATTPDYHDRVKQVVVAVGPFLDEATRLALDEK